MREQSWFNLVAGSVAALIVVFGLVAVVYPASTAPAATSTTSTGSPVVYRNLSIAFNPSRGTFDYSSAALSVPAGVRVVFTITNYDPSVARVPTSSDAQVLGTIGNTISVASAGHTMSMTVVPTTDISHTFTISSGGLHLNVPVPPAASSTSPTEVTFSAVFPVTGTFEWGCVVLCGPDGTMALSTMYGTLTVS